VYAPLPFPMALHSSIPARHPIRAWFMYLSYASVVSRPGRAVSRLPRLPTPVYCLSILGKFPSSSPAPVLPDKFLSPNFQSQ
jgi:hypothetical protein